METQRTTFTYTRKPLSRAFSLALPFTVTYPMLWVHFNSRGRVNEVFVMEYAGTKAIRLLHTVRLSPCDPTDRTVEHVAWAPDPELALQQLKKHF